MYKCRKECDRTFVAKDGRVSQEVGPSDLAINKTYAHLSSVGFCGSGTSWDGQALVIDF